MQVKKKQLELDMIARILLRIFVSMFISDIGL